MILRKFIDAPLSWTQLSKKELKHYRTAQFSHNIRNIRTMSALVIFLATLLLLVNYRVHGAEVLGRFSHYTILYLSMFLISIAAFFVFSRLTDCEMTPLGVFAEYAYPMAITLAVTGITILDIRTTGQIISFLIGIMVIALLFRTTTRRFLFFASIAIALLITGIVAEDLAPLLTMNYIINSLAISILALVIFHIAEKNRLRDFLQQRLIENQRDELQELSITDTLTGVRNRRYLYEILPGECDRARRYQRKLCLMVVDVDHFKKINDTLGHQTGDTVLWKTAQNLKDSVRQTDTVARYGGEEFVVLLIEIEAAQALQCAERIRKKCEGTMHEGVSWPVTVSIGLAEYEGEEPDQLVARADTRLYQAKNSGRNRIIFD